MNIEPKLYTQVDEISCDYHRIVIPSINLNDLKLKVPVFLFNRTCRLGVNFLHKIRSQGVKIVCDLDDFQELDESHYLKDAQRDGDMSKNILESIKISDWCLATTSVLASRVLDQNPNVMVVPNALPFDSGQFTRSEDRYSKSKVVYVAGKSHIPDIGLIGEFDSSLTICGVDYKLSNQKYSVVEDHLPLHEYMSLYDGHQVAIAPLVNTKFNRCKSNLKLLEAGAKGIPLFASEVLPYYNNTDMKVIKYVPDYMFKEHISRYSNQSLIELGEETAEHVRKHYSLVDANLLRKQLFESFQ